MNEYIIFDNPVPFLNNAPFYAGVTLLEMLHIAKEKIQQEKKDPGFDIRALNPELFVKIFAKTLAEAGSCGQDLVALENSSYLGLLYAKKILLNNEKIRNDVNELLKSHNLDCKKLANVIHINELLCSKSSLKFFATNLKHPFKNFKAGIYAGPNLDENFPSACVSSVLKAIDLKQVFLENERSISGYPLFSYSPDIAMKFAGEILFEAFDSGCDFLVVSDIRCFSFFDSFQKKISKTAGRAIKLPILSLPQVVLLSLGITDKKVLGLDKHVILPNFI